MSTTRPVIAPIENPPLDQALRRKLERRGEVFGHLGELEPLALQLGLIQNKLKPRFEAPQLVVFAADHGLAADGIGVRPGRSTAQLVGLLLNGQLPVAAFARIQGLELSVVDSGVAEPLDPHPRLIARKLGHATRSARSGPAMSAEQAEAGVRAGQQVARSLPGNVVACAGIGAGSNESAALVLARLTGADLARLVAHNGPLPDAAEEQTAQVLRAALTQQKDALDPLDVTAAFGGFEVAMLVGLMLQAASERRLVIVDGMAACAAMLVATRLSPAVADYCVHCRSHASKALDEALALVNSAALLELGIESMDGTGATLAWPLIRSAAALLTEVEDGSEPGATLAGRPTPLG